MPAETTEQGDEVFVAEDEPEIGSKAPFYVVYRSADREVRWGYFCGSCDSFDTAMDPMARITCNTCGNTRKPEDWDAAHE